MSAPLVVNTRDGMCWTRRTVTSSGIALYAPEGVCQCPPFVMATLAELAEHGISGSADVLPVPVGPEPSERDRLRAAYIEALDNAHETHPCPVTGRPYWTGCVHYDEAGRVVGVGSCHSERRADAVLAVRDAELERLRARVAELLAERHATNEALDDVARALREQRDRFETLRALCDAADHVGIVSGGWFTVEAVRKAAAGESLPKPDGITRRIAPVQALQEGEHYAVVHHAYRVGRDLPETGGAK